MNELIFDLLALEGFAKDLHYSIADYGVHLFCDRVAEGLSDFIDEIKENCIIAREGDLLLSAEYYRKSAEIIPTDKSLLKLRDLLIKILSDIEGMQNLSSGDSDLMGRIGTKLQNDLGVLNIVLGENR